MNAPQRAESALPVHLGDKQLVLKKNSNILSQNILVENNFI